MVATFTMLMKMMDGSGGWQCFNVNVPVGRNNAKEK